MLTFSRYVMFDMACDAGWSTRVSQDYRSHEKDLGFTADQFMKCKSQALAEQASGDVYFFISKGDEADPNSAVRILHYIGASPSHFPSRQSQAAHSLLLTPNLRSVHFPSLPFLFTCPGPPQG